MTSIPARGLCLVKMAETAESFAGGKIILPESVREGMAQYQCEVLAVGCDELCDDKKCDRLHYMERSPDAPEPERIHPFDVKSGAWVVVKHRSLSPSDDPLGKTFYVRQCDVLAVLCVSP